MVRVNLRMTEKRRLAMAAAAIRQRMTTRKRALLFSLATPESGSRDLADILAIDVGILWTGCGVDDGCSRYHLPSSLSCTELLENVRRTAWSLCVVV